MLKSTKILFSLVLVAAIFLVIFTAIPFVAYAEEAPEQGVVVVTEEEQGKSETEELVDRFIENLKAKYGEDYEYYLNAILEQWGSVEAYLLAQTDNLPDEFQTGYTDFIYWLGKYAPVWAPIMAVVLVIVGYIVGKKALNKMLARLVDARVSPIQNELNKQSEAQAAQLKATRALLGTNEKFAEERKTAEAAEKKLLE